MNFKAGTLRYVASAMVLAAACKREPTETPATSSELAAASAGETPPGDAGQGGGAAGDGVAAASDGGSQAGPTEAAATTGEPAEPNDPPAATGGAPAAASGETKAAASEPGPLPAPLHTKIDEKCGRDPGVGTAAVPFTLKTPEGKDLSLASLRGKVVLLNFWGTWCKPCLKELPEFDRLVRHYRKHGAVLVAVATDTEPEKVLEFAKSRKLAAKLALGGEDLAKQYDSPNFPFSFVVDDKGTIRGSYRSFRPECLGKLEQDIRTSLEARRR